MAQTTRNLQLVLYLPVIHRGYLDLIKKYRTKLETIWVLSNEVIKLIDKELNYLRKDIRRLSPTQAVKVLEGLELDLQVRLMSLENLSTLNARLVMPDDDVSDVLIKLFFNQKQKIILEPIFLRWDKRNTFDKKPPRADLVISQDKFDQAVMKQAFFEAGRSTDWWRHVGAALVKDGQVILTLANQHTPGGYTPYLDGDPRSISKSGQDICANTSRHAESAIIAEAAKQGIKTTNCSLYVTTFPCPYCARVVAHAGIKTLYFAEGYTVLDGEEELKRAGVKIVKVNVPQEIIKSKDKRSKLKNYQSLNTK